MADKIKGIRIKTGENEFDDFIPIGDISNLQDGNAQGSLRTINSAKQENEYLIGENAFSEGLNTQASGINSHAEGNNTQATGENSHAQNLGTIASGVNQTVIGRYNKGFSNNNEYALVIGNGIDDSARSNALTVQWNGNTNITGDAAISGDTNIINGNLKIADKDVIQKDTNDNNETEIIVNADYIRLNEIEDAILQVNDENKSVLTVDKIHLNEGGTIQNFNALQHLFDGEADGSLRTSNSQQEEEEGEYSLGENAFAEGLNTRASGNNSHAEGYLQKTGQGVTINYYKDITPKSENFAIGKIEPVYDDQNQVSYWRFNGQNAGYIKKFNYDYFCCYYKPLESLPRYPNIIKVASFNQETQKITFESNIDIESISNTQVIIGPIIPLETGTDNLINSEIIYSSIPLSAMGASGTMRYYYMIDAMLSGVQKGDYIYDTTNNNINAYVANISNSFGYFFITLSNDIFDATHLNRTFNVIRGNYLAESLETSGTNAHSEGKNTAAKGENSHTQNLGTISETDNQTVIGTYNKVDFDNDYAFIIGNGQNTFNRSNALEVDWNGNTNIAGALTVNNQPLFKTQWVTTESKDVNANTQTYLDATDYSLTGYTPVGVIAHKFSVTTGFASAFFIHSTYDSGSTWRTYVQNTASNATGVTCQLKFLYIKTALVQAL